MIFNTPIPANDGKHKYMIVLRKDGRTKTVKWGAIGYEHFTSGHLNEARRQNYLQRHKNKEDWNNERTSGYYAYNHLWRFRTLNEANKWIKADLRSKGYK